LSVSHFTGTSSRLRIVMGNMLYEFIGLCEFIGMLFEFTRTYGFRHVI